MTAMSDILKDKPFLVVQLPNGDSYETVLYGEGWFDLMHAAMRMDGWLLRVKGYVPAERIWGVRNGLETVHD